MTIVGECVKESHRRSKFQKSPLKLISQVTRTTIGRVSGECAIVAPPKGNILSVDRDKLSGARTEKGRYPFLSFFSHPFVRIVKQLNDVTNKKVIYLFIKVKALSKYNRNSGEYFKKQEEIYDEFRKE